MDKDSIAKAVVVYKKISTIKDKHHVLQWDNRKGALSKILPMKPPACKTQMNLEGGSLNSECLVS